MTRLELGFLCVLNAGIILLGLCFNLLYHESTMLNACEDSHPRAKCEIVAVPMEGQP